MERHQNKICSERNSSQGKLALVFDAPGKYGWTMFLFPENTFNQRNNGLRKDVPQMLVGLKPPALFCIGRQFDGSGRHITGRIVLNGKTLGDPLHVWRIYSTWGYRCSYGFGYYEMLQFCEDINAKGNVCV